jgi:hypothetical protein
MTVKIEVDKNEWYPVYDFKVASSFNSVEVDEKTLKRWQRSFKLFRKVQDELETIYIVENL